MVLPGCLNPDLEFSVQGLEDSISRVSRLIWALHLAFNQGVSEEFYRVLTKQYPKHLLPELQSSCQVRCCECGRSRPTGQSPISWSRTLCLTPRFAELSS